MRSRFNLSLRLAQLIQDEFVVFGTRALKCNEAAALLNGIDSMTSTMPRIAAPPKCEAPETLASIPHLMTGHFRRQRFYLLLQYLRSIREGVSTCVDASAQENAACGRWNSYARVRALQWRARAGMAMLAVRGLLFVAHVPVNFEKPCQSLSKLIGARMPHSQAG